MVHLSLLKEDPMLSPPTWSIHHLLPGFPLLMKRGPEDVRVSHITHRSNEVRPGSLFVAIKGYQADGHAFIPDAVARGARCIVLEDASYIPARPSTLFVQVADSRRAMALIASHFYGVPSRRLTLVGVTGTNGKTTLTYLLESVFNAAGLANGVLGTINYRYGETTIEARTTTPDPLILQKTLADMVSSGVKVASMEVSSHALALRRIAGCHFDVAIWTNLSQDHLDFHHTMEAYYETKKTLFTHHLKQSGKPVKHAVINLDDTYGRQLFQELEGVPILTYGTGTEADIHPASADLNASGTYLSLETPSGEISFHSNLIGHHNLMNLLAAVAVSVALKIPFPYIVEGLKAVTVPGRLQPVENPLGIDILIDYAHTPDALENVLKSIKSLARGRIITVFGCGGDRDRAKRPLMGGIAEKLSDLVILTDDNPRTEDGETILNEIESGISFLPRLREEDVASAIKGYLKVSNRKRAIELAVQAASPGDLILIAGKGHEAYQIIGRKRIPFSDLEVARQAVREKTERKT